MGAWIDGDGRCTSCGDYARDCVCDMCETCSALAPAGSMETCDECGSLICETCEECMACAPVCERCEERARDLASACPDDWNAPRWCGACRALMFTPRDIMRALGDALPGVRIVWGNTGGGVYNVEALLADDDGNVTHCVGISDNGEWVASDMDTRAACVSIGLQDALSGDMYAGSAWTDHAPTMSDYVYADTLPAVVDYVRAAVAHVVDIP